MLEIELKFRAAAFAPVERQLAAWGATPAAPITEEDQYFNAPDRDFATTDEVLRLRRIDGSNRITYKGSKRPAGPGGAKSRPEIEIPYADGAEAAAQFRQLLLHLGYRPSAVVRKRRQIFHLRRAEFALEVCLDEVEGLGRFVEVEIVAAEGQAAAAERVLQDVSAALGLTEVEPRAYLQMVLGA
jgi:adenylate cyclase class 2